MKINGSIITFYRGDDDALVVGLAGGQTFEADDKVSFSLKTSESISTDILTIESQNRVAYNGVENAGIRIDIRHAQTMALEKGTYYYDVLIEWANGTFVTVVPPTKFILAVGASNG